MNETDLKIALAQMDAEIADKRGDVEDAQLELKHLAEKRRAFAKRNCPHTNKYTRSIMGRETERRCELCNEEV